MGLILLLVLVFVPPATAQKESIASMRKGAAKLAAVLAGEDDES